MDFIHESIGTLMLSNVIDAIFILPSVCFIPDQFQLSDGVVLIRPI
ncbi:hypothetical Protein YC6258_01222 [Gynuella sunshinyii YC6258]|uniref:Uncharacterized protein n=1 Tax=Gynuella sunshinyii YC6258 TaxID=1445510 RepID=A0A0C5V199_9GAMM|nr:hypothetical Protein YC6258_01222 [Gynuella sunshinyii YC6258]